VKSAEPVAASVASEEIRDDQTAPLWPMKVPILVWSARNEHVWLGSPLPIPCDAIPEHRIIVYLRISTRYVIVRAVVYL
jgi:hypothetical protein